MTCAYPPLLNCCAERTLTAKRQTGKIPRDRYRISRVPGQLRTSALGPNVKCRLGPDTSDAGGKLDIPRTSRIDVNDPTAEVGPASEANLFWFACVSQKGTDRWLEPAVIGPFHFRFDCLAAMGLLRSEWRTGEIPVAREQRKLAAIIAADVVGYSRLMGRDESGTLARLRRTAPNTSIPCWRNTEGVWSS